MMKFRNFSGRMENDDITEMKVLKQALLLSSHAELKLLSNSSYICMYVCMNYVKLKKKSM